MKSVKMRKKNLKKRNKRKHQSCKSIAYRIDVFYCASNFEYIFDILYKSSTEGYSLQTKKLIPSAFKLDILVKIKS